MSKQIAILASKSLLGSDVVNAKGETLGRVEEVMLDMENGGIAYTVLSFSSLPGFQDKFFAVPWPALTVDKDSEQVVMDVKKDNLKYAPGFDEDDWPQKANLHWLRQVHNHYGHSCPP